MTHSQRHNGEDSKKGNGDLIDWTKAHSIALEWNDGHTPESLLIPPLSSSSSTASSQQQQQQQQPKQYMRLYPKYHCASKVAVYCVDDALPPELTNAIYQHTTTTTTSSTTQLSQKNPTPWGTYVTLEEIRDYWRKQSSSFGGKDKDEGQDDSSGRHEGSEDDADPNTVNNNNDTNSNDMQTMNIQHSLALRAAAAFLRHASTSSSNAPCASTSTARLLSQPVPDLPLWTAADNGDSLRPTTNDSAQENFDCKVEHTTHGVAVWALASNSGSHVPYHIDYAELIRYETGITVPPVLAGTLQCSRLESSLSSACNISSETNCAVAAADRSKNEPFTKCEDGNSRAIGIMVGGDYLVHTGRGKETDVLYHYQKHGYKGNLSSGTPWSESHQTDDDEHWVRVPYKFNRMICQSGHLPHLSTRIESIQDIDSNAIPESDTKRVIMGFNVFMHDVGPAVQEAPEHSEEFRQRIRRSKEINRSNGVSLTAISANPRLRAMMIRAKREKDRQEFAKAQTDLNEKMREFLLGKHIAGNDDRTSTPTATVHELLHMLFPTLDSMKGCRDSWPCTITDVHVHVHRQWKQGTVQCYQWSDESRTKELIQTNSCTFLIKKSWFIEYSKVKQLT